MTRQLLLPVMLTCLGLAARADMLPDRQAGDEFQVNSQEYGDQRVPFVAVHPDGNGLVIWQWHGGPVASWDVLARRVDPGGVLPVPEFQVNDFDRGRQDGQHLAALPGGGFVAVWSGENRLGEPYVIQARRLDAAAHPIGSDLEVGGVPGELNIRPRVVGAEGDRFLVAWEGYDPNDGTLSIHGQWMSAIGAQAGPRLRISLQPGTAQRHVDLARNRDGRILAVWQSSEQDGSSWGVYGRCLDDNGGDSGEFLINQSTEGAQGRPRAAALGEAGFAVAWQDNRGLSSFEYQRIMLRHLDTGCQPRGDEQQVNVFDEGIQDLPAIAAAASGRQVVIWQSNPENFEDQGIYARLVDADGRFHGDPLRVSQEREAYQDFPEAAMLDDDGFIAVWESIGQDLSGFGIFARRIHPPRAATLEIVSGNGQSTGVGQAFDRPLVVQVSDQWGVSLPGQTVRFIGSEVGAGALFANGGSEQTRLTDGRGLASVEVLANGNSGVHEVHAHLDGAGLAAGFRLENRGSLLPEPHPVPSGRWPGWLLLVVCVLLTGWLPGRNGRTAR